MNRRRTFTSIELAAFGTGRRDGAAAFADGKVCTPALDPAARSSLGTLPKLGLVSHYLDGWHRGWAEANVAAPVVAS